jgi:GT2 family glycosyltransferase
MMVNPVICPVLLGVRMTRNCVQSILAQDIPVTPIMIDNGSSDGCAAYLRSQPVVTIAYSYPHGLHRVWNRALRFVFDEQHCDHALVVNNDIILRPDAYRLLLDDGGPFVTGVSVGSTEQMIEADPTMKRPHPDFSCFLIRHEVWERIGEFDEDFFIYAGDSSYHIRMERAGISACSIAVPFFHESSGTLKNADSDLRNRICAQADKDRATFVQKFGCHVGSPEYYALFQHKEKPSVQ